MNTTAECNAHVVLIMKNYTIFGWLKTTFFSYCKNLGLVHEQGPLSKNTTNVVDSKDHKAMAKEHMTKYLTAFC